MQGLITRLMLLAALCMPAAVLAQAAPTHAPPEGFTAPADPRPEDTNAERARSQPGNNAPFWRAVRNSGEQAGYTSLPAPEAGVLIQRTVQYPGSLRTTAGEAWRQVRNQWILPYGGALLLIVLVAIALFYWRKGPLDVHDAPTGRMVERFTYFERAAHWVNAIAFSILAISGIVMAFGKFFLLPVLGGTLFGWLAYGLKNLHNFAGPVFAVSLVVVILTFIKDNLPTRDDLAWLAKGGGLFSGEHVPSHRFNAGEKLVFWGGVLLLGLVVVGSGLVLDKLIPGWGETRGQMQVTHMVHAVAAILMMALFLGHIYMGTVGMKGAYQAMKTGYVDETWAREHHELWYDDIRAGKIPAQRSARPAPSGRPVTPSA
ncbi:formate dehydrogenase subunit gamma [Caldimonas thermodepolymerans]|uniref:Formate dehydrogenase gamma subunit n=1 Tax=Caldimonas thermodepolymerans TaxID=215580 RepID=A0AA46DFD2_9BURK|nr:formate dehydrogenase subunit gamma [Caldimonas thermodepolymerans]TCP08772.1 formate dehydrogenase gamma subunit [Caldimonas thermodepolymerans]UZG47094.1 formate dehydrogenase subunit gamma [Caldimonas thermodepolymerans]